MIAGSQVQAAHAASGLTIGQFARMLGAAPARVQTWMHDNRVPGEDQRRAARIVRIIEQAQTDSDGRDVRTVLLDPTAGDSLFHKLVGEAAPKRPFVFPLAA